MDGRPQSVALVIQTRVTDEGVPAYAAWQARLGGILAGQPGFLGQEVRTPVPPKQVDWFVIQHFADRDSARRWLESSVLQQELKAVEPFFIGDSNFSIVDETTQTSTAATLSVTCIVKPELEAQFLEWEREIFREESRFPGFLGHRIDRPVPGLQPRWTTAITFATDEDLDRWLKSPKRAELIAKGEHLQDQMVVSKAGYGFDFWSANGGPKETAESILKGNLIVLLVLYPVVFLWGYFVGTPLLGHWPFWLALFVGNLFSTQVLGWFVAPRAFKALGWWLAPKLSLGQQLKGYGLIAVGYLVSLAVYAWLISAKLMG